MKIAIITFSPTGGTIKCAERLAKVIGEIVQKIDMSVRDFAECSILEEVDVAILAVPSYGGRVPSLAAERLKKINGKHKRAVLLTVYGNRAFEDTLVELEDIARAQKFVPVAAVAAIAQHCMDTSIASNRPDADDMAKLDDFGKKIANKLSKGQSTDFNLVIPGNRPYKKAGAGMHPKTDKTCSACGLCVRQCPAGAIMTDDPTKIDTDKCIGCMRCVVFCPSKSKHLSAANRLVVHGFLSITAGKRKEPELF